MIPTYKARTVVRKWNKTHPYALGVAWETVAECLTAFSRWRDAFATWQAPHEVTEHLLRHYEFARQIPDELLLLLSDEDYDEEKANP